MLNMNSSSFNFSGTSDINGQSIASFAAGYSGNDVYFSINIMDINGYEENEETFVADFNSFRTAVMNTITSINE